MLATNTWATPTVGTPPDALSETEKASGTMLAASLFCTAFHAESPAPGAHEFNHAASKTLVRSLNIKV